MGIIWKNLIPLCSSKYDSFEDAKWIVITNIAHMAFNPLHVHLAAYNNRLICQSSISKLFGLVEAPKTRLKN